MYYKNMHDFVIDTYKGLNLAASFGYFKKDILGDHVGYLKIPGSNRLFSYYNRGYLDVNSEHGVHHDLRPAMIVYNEDLYIWSDDQLTTVETPPNHIGESPKQFYCLYNNVITYSEFCRYSKIHKLLSHERKLKARYGLS